MSVFTEPGFFFHIAVVVCVLQRAAFAHFPELQDFALSNVAAVDTRESLTKHFGNLR